VVGPGLDDTVAQVSGGAVTWLLTDDQGSTRLQVNNGGTVLSSITYDANGKMVSGALTGGPGYTGQRQDAATGLIGMGNGAREYNPATGRFNQPDPGGFATSGPNLYEYAANAPTDGTDPSGNLLVAVGDAAKGEALWHLQNTYGLNPDQVAVIPLGAGSTDIWENASGQNLYAIVPKQAPVVYNTGGAEQQNLDSSAVRALWAAFLSPRDNRFVAEVGPNGATPGGVAWNQTGGNLHDGRAAAVGPGGQQLYVGTPFAAGLLSPEQWDKLGGQEAWQGNPIAATDVKAATAAADELAALMRQAQDNFSVPDPYAVALYERMLREKENPALLYTPGAYSPLTLPQWPMSTHSNTVMSSDALANPINSAPWGPAGRLTNPSAFDRAVIGVAARSVDATFTVGDPALAIGSETYVQPVVRTVQFTDDVYGVLTDPYFQPVLPAYRAYVRDPSWETWFPAWASTTGDVSSTVLPLAQAGGQALAARAAARAERSLGGAVAGMERRAVAAAAEEGTVVAEGNAPASGAAANPAQRRVLYHYTDEAGLKGITESKELRPSLQANNPKDVRYGEGQYLSDFAPGENTPAQLSREFLGQPFQGRRFTHYVEVDVTGLEVVQGRNGVFVVPGNKPLDLTGRIVGSGPVPPAGK
jgi:RHS repeat-associated protein